VYSVDEKEIEAAIELITQNIEKIKEIAKKQQQELVGKTLS